MPRDPRAGALARRDMLLVSGLGLTLAATPSCAEGAPQFPGREAMVEGASARSFGAIGDGQYHALSTRFATLAAAQAVYPFVQRLDQSIDWAGIQAAINSVEASGGGATIPIGRFVISDSLRLPSAVTLRGEARSGSIIDNQNHQLDAPQIVNKDPNAFLYATIRDLTLHGGTHAIKVHATKEVAGIVIEGITTNLQTEGNITFSSMQTTVIRDCHLMDGSHGVSVESFPCNSVHLINTRLGRHSNASIRLRGVDGFAVFGGSIEGGGVAGRGTIDIETGGAYARAIHFQNVYFENTHEFLLRSRGAGTVAFRGCKITGTSALGGGIGPYHFDCGDDLIVFSDNQWDRPTPGPVNMLIEGRNDGLGGRGNLWRERSGRTARLESRSFSMEEARRGLFAIDFGGASGRAYGSIEFHLDAGDDRPTRRIVLPVDVAIVERRVTAFPPSAVGDMQLMTAIIDNKVRVGVRAAPGVAAYHRLWFRLELSANTTGAMSVNVL